MKESVKLQHHNEAMLFCHSKNSVIVITVGEMNACFLYCITVLRYKAFNPVSMLFNLVAG